MERGVLRVKKRIGEAGTMRLYRLRVVVPETDWQRLPKLSSAEVEKIPTPWWEKKPKATKRNAASLHLPRLVGPRARSDHC